MHFHQWKRRQILTLLGGVAASGAGAAGGEGVSAGPTLERHRGFARSAALRLPERHAQSRLCRRAEPRRRTPLRRGPIRGLAALARELLAWNPDALFVSTTPASLAAKAATSTVPIVMVSVADPLG